MKKVLIILLAILIFSTFCYAEAAQMSVDTGIVTSESGNFSVQILNAENKIPIGGKATIDLRINNNENTSIKYRFNFDNTGEWTYVRTNPSYHALSGMDVDALSNATTTIEVQARDETSYGTYFIKTTIINDATKEQVIVLLPVGIKTEEELAGIRLPDLRVSLDVPTRIDPREENSITVYLLNKNNRNITELTIDLESKLLGKKTIKESIGPNEEKEVNVKLELDPLTKPQEDTVKGLVTVGEYTFTPTEKTFQISNYNSQLNVEETTEDSFLKTIKTITIENKGNGVISDTIKSERKILSSLFTKTEPEARIVEIENKKYYSWPVNVDPTVKSSIKITTNYQPLFWIIVTIIAILIVMYIAKSKVKVYKKSTGTETKEGGLSNIKILLTIRNDTGKPIKDIEIKDIIPQIADIAKDFPEGTIKPDKILMHKIRGTIVKWKIDELDIHEERIIKYNIKSKLSIIGSFTLPATKVIYRTPRGRERTAQSNKLTVGKEE